LLDKLGAMHIQKRISERLLPSVFGRNAIKA